MNRTYLRAAALVTVLPLTIFLFARYLATHTSLRHQLLHTNPWVLVLLIGLYMCCIATNALIQLATLRLCKISLEPRENLLLTMYTSMVNFFGPLQSGPAFRVVYLKKKHSVKLKNYAVATLVYYALYAAFNGLFLLSGILDWWLAGLAVGGLGILGLTRNTKFWQRFKQLDLGGLGFLAGATLLLVCLLSLIFYIELKTVVPSVHFSQAIVYAGAANLALFVSFTPGAIGFRESFLYFSQRLHHLGTATIIAANLIDRSVYIVTLVILAVYIFGSHARKQLKSEAH